MIIRDFKLNIRDEPEHLSLNRCGLMIHLT